MWFSWHFAFWGSAPWVPVWESSSACVRVCVCSDFSPLTNCLTHFMAFYFQHLRGPLCTTTEAEARSSRARRPVVRVKKTFCFFPRGLFEHISTDTYFLPVTVSFTCCLGYWHGKTRTCWAAEIIMIHISLTYTSSCAVQIALLVFSYRYGESSQSQTRLPSSSRWILVEASRNKTAIVSNWFLGRDEFSRATVAGCQSSGPPWGGDATGRLASWVSGWEFCKLLRDVITSQGAKSLSSASAVKSYCSSEGKGRSNLAPQRWCVYLCVAGRVNC